MNLLKKIISGRYQSKSRFRDEKDNPIHLRDYIYFFLALVGYIKKLLKIPPQLPWINYTAIKIIKIIIKKKQISVLEFGSGSSTLWWQKQNITKITSVEDNKDWYEKIKKKIKLQNKVNLFYFENKNEYISVGKTEKYDFITVDGSVRSKCMKYILENNIHDSSIIYFDNSDKGSSILKIFAGSESLDYRLCENLMREHSVTNDRIIFTCRNFCPADLFVMEGMFSVPRVFAEDKELTKIIP